MISEDPRATNFHTLLSMNVGNWLELNPSKVEKESGHQSPGFIYKYEIISWYT